MINKGLSKYLCQASLLVVALIVFLSVFHFNAITPFVSIEHNELIRNLLQGVMAYDTAIIAIVPGLSGNHIDSLTGKFSFLKHISVPVIKRIKDLREDVTRLHVLGLIFTIILYLLEGLYSPEKICVITIVVLIIFLVCRIFALFDLAHIQNSSQEKNLVNNQIENLLNRLRETRGDFTYTSIIEDLLQIYNTPIISQEIRNKALGLMFEFFPDVMEMENYDELRNTLSLFKSYLSGAVQ
jgi:hypothetical protein